MPSRIARGSRALVGSVLALSLLVAGPAASALIVDGAERSVNRGACSGPTRWRLVAISYEGVIRVRFVAKGGRPDHRWHVFMDHNRDLLWAGARISGEDGFFRVRARSVDLPDVDRIRAAARNRLTGEVCRGRVAI